MARKSIIEREKKKIKLVDKYASKRAALKQEQKQAATFEEKMDRLTSELSDLFEESKSLEEKIKENLRGIGYEL